MRNLRGTYVHRGDRARRARRIRHLLAASCFALATTLVLVNRRPPTATAEAAPVSDKSGFSFGFGGETSRLRNELETTKGELDLMRAQYERADRVLKYSTRYQIPGDLASSIFDVAMAEGIDPELAFRLVKLESDFNQHATSPVGAVGLTQVMPSTARYFKKGIDREGLYDPKTNLHVGFRYLRTLVDQYKGNTKLALLVYNRGEVAVRAAMAAGDNPSNGYDRILTKGYKGKGVIE